MAMVSSMAVGHLSLQPLETKVMVLPAFGKKGCE